MKKSQKPQYILNDGSIVVFSNAKLKSAILRKKNELVCAGKKCSQQELIESIAEDTGISFSAIKHWCAGHNTPSDLDKVRDLAAALNVEMNYLLDKEMEDSVDMNNTNNDRIIPAIDYSTTKSVIRGIYGNLVEYIELCRNLGSSADGEPYKYHFKILYTNLMKARLDVPQKEFDRLCSFAVNYLQQFSSYFDFLDYIEMTENEDFLGVELSDPTAFLDEYSNTYVCPSCAPWLDGLYVSIDSDNEFCKAFEDAVKIQCEWDNSVYAIDSIAHEVIIKTAYDCIEKILSDYRA